MSDKTFLGSGWRFPVEFEARTRAVKMVSDQEDIEQSLAILLSTRPGERVMQPDYGCALQALVFEMVNERAVLEIREAVERAVLFYEPRVSLNGVDVDTQMAAEGELRIVLSYTIRSTNTRSNIVYPFYFREGTHVRF